MATFGPTDLVQFLPSYAQANGGQIKTIIRQGVSYDVPVTLPALTGGTISFTATSWSYDDTGAVVEPLIVNGFPSSLDIFIGEYTYELTSGTNSGWVDPNSSQIKLTASGLIVAPTAPLAVNDTFATQLTEAIAATVNVAGNDTPCPAPQVTTWVLTGTPVNCAVTGSPSSNGDFDVTPASVGNWSFTYEIFCDGAGSGETATMSGTAQAATPSNAYVTLDVIPSNNLNWDIGSASGNTSLIETSSGTVFATGDSGSIAIPAGMTQVSIVSDATINPNWSFTGNNSDAVQDVVFVDEGVRIFFMNNADNYTGDASAFNKSMNNLFNIQISNGGATGGVDMQGNYPAMQRGQFDAPSAGNTAGVIFNFPTEVNAPVLQRWRSNNYNYVGATQMTWGLGGNLTVPPFTGLTILQLTNSSVQSLVLPASVANTLTELSINANDIPASDIDAMLIALDAGGVSGGVMNYGSQSGGGHLDANRSPAGTTAVTNLFTTKGWTRSGGY